MRYLGCAYYPEYWGMNRLREDIRLMLDAGINTVRMGEFAWCRLEPEEGVYNFDWLHESIAAFGASGINVVICTPTAAPPAWLTSVYPETLAVRADGRRLTHGARRHYCFTSPEYRRHCGRMAAKLAVELAGYGNIIAWQIDNELGPNEDGALCHCEGCQARFQGWLQKRYGSLTELNRKWGTGFWSMDYSDWRQIRLADARAWAAPSRKLDAKRFAAEMIADFAIEQASSIREYCPGIPVSTNCDGTIFGMTDYFQLFDRLDAPFLDLYFDLYTMDVSAMVKHVYRSLGSGRGFWVTETGAGALDHGRPPHPDQFKAWMWSSYAHGADAYLVFRWRTCLSGQEQDLQGILEHSGHAGHRYQAVKNSFLELRDLRAELGELPPPCAEAAIVHDYQTMWGYEASVVGNDLQYLPNMSFLHKALYKKNVLTDIVSPNADLSRYRLVILPSLMMIGADFANRLHAFVESGGVVMAQGQIGLRDLQDNYLINRGPDHLQDLLGVYLNGGMYLHSQVAPDEAIYLHPPRKRDVEIKLQGMMGSRPVNGTAAVWVGDLEFISGEVLLRFSEDTYQGQPAVVLKKTGRGAAVYAAAARLDENLLDALVEYVLSMAGIRFLAGLPIYVEVIRRGGVTFIINHRDEEIRYPIDACQSLIAGVAENGTAVLKPDGVCLLRDYPNT